MAAANTDLLTQATTNSRPSPTQVTTNRVGGGTTLAVNALTGWPTATAVHFITYKIDTSGNKVAGTQIDMKGVVSGTSITQIVIKAGNDTGNAIGDIVEAAPTAAWANDLYTWGSAHSNQDGSLTTASVQAALGITTPGGNGWTIIPYTATYGANNGNKEFTVTYPLDLTPTLSAGMKMQHTRGTTAPTQCMAFTAASSQYASKSSPTGITFTSAFTCETWIKLNSYTGQIQYFGGRTDNSTGGFAFGCTAAGQLYILYGASSSFTTLTSYQSLPINRWIHVAVSISSVSSKTAIMYINGTSVPFATGGSATTLTQTGNLFVSGNVTNTYLDGEASEFRIWSAAQSQANIQTNMAISLTGSETNLVALFQGNGNFNDKTSNANNLTASGGALATQVANPYNNIEYAEIVSVSYSSPNTTITLNTGDFGSMPNMTLTNPQYSTTENPFGLPQGVNGASLKRFVSSMVGFNTSSTTTIQLSGITTSLTIPFGVNQLEVTFDARGYNSTAASDVEVSIWQGTVGSGVQWATDNAALIATGNAAMPVHPHAIIQVVPGPITINVGVRASAGTAFLEAAAGYPMKLTVKGA